MQAPRALVIDLLEWIEAEPRCYRKAQEAWRTSCPRLPVWEDAFHLGYVAASPRTTGGVLVKLTEQGREALAEHRGCAP